MSDFETTQKKHNIVVGMFVLIGLCALVWLIFKFGDLPVAVSELNSFQIVVQFPTAKGIQKNAPVEFCGYQVGKVTHVMAPESMLDLKTGLYYHQTKVLLSIDKRYADIPSNVDVKLMTRSLGSSYIELMLDPTKPLEAADPNRPETKYLISGMTMQGSTGMTSEFFPAESQQKLVELIDGVNELVTNAVDIIGRQENKDNFRQILANLADSSSQLRQTLDDIRKFATAGATTFEHADSKIDQAVATFNTIGQDFHDLADAGTSTLQNINKNADNIVASADELVNSLIETTVQFNQAIDEMHSILAKVNTGQGTAGRILNDGTVYENLLENTEQLETLLEEMTTFVQTWRDKKLQLALISF